MYNQDGSSAIHLASYVGHVEIVKFLIPKCGDGRFDLDNAGNTCLHWAAQEGHLAVVKYLVEECGFNPNLENQVGCCVYACVCWHYSAWHVWGGCGCNVWVCHVCVY